MLTEVRDAFLALPLRPLAGGAESEDAARRRADQLARGAAHNIIYGLSRATAHPPSWFRMTGRTAMGTVGRPKATEATFVALICRMEFERITGTRATVSWHPDRESATGAFYELVAHVFRVMDLPDDPRNRALATLRKP